MTQSDHINPDEQTHPAPACRASSKSTYNVSIQGPSGSTVAFYRDGASPVTRTTATQVYGPNSWKVLSTDGTVYTADTYAYCWGV